MYKRDILRIDIKAESKPNHQGAWREKPKTQGRFSALKLLTDLVSLSYRPAFYDRTLWACKTETFDMIMRSENDTIRRIFISKTIHQ